MANSSVPDTPARPGALAPLGPILIEWGGPGAALSFLVGLTYVNIVLVGLLWLTVRKD